VSVWLDSSEVAEKGKDKYIHRAQCKDDTENDLLSQLEGQSPYDRYR
jgi:hypothetical protein